MPLGEARNTRNARGFTLVEVLVVVAIVPLVLSAAFGAVSVALRAYKLAEARSVLSSGGMVAMAMVTQDLQAASHIYDDSSPTRLHGRLQDGLTDVVYEFTPPSGSEPGRLTRNGSPLFEPDISVTACEFGYFAPGTDVDAPLQQVAPELASSVKVRLTITSGPTSMTYESLISSRNL